MVNVICKVCLILLSVVVAVILLPDGSSDDTIKETSLFDQAEFYAKELTDNDEKVTFNAITETGSMRTYHIAGMYSIEHKRKPVQAPDYALNSKHKIRVFRDEVGIYYVTVYPIALDD